MLIWNKDKELGESAGFTPAQLGTVQMSLGGLRSQPWSSALVFWGQFIWVIFYPLQTLKICEPTRGYFSPVAELSAGVCSPLNSQ